MVTRPSKDEPNSLVDGVPKLRVWYRFVLEVYSEICEMSCDFWVEWDGKAVNGGVGVHNEECNELGGPVGVFNDRLQLLRPSKWLVLQVTENT